MKFTITDEAISLLDEINLDDRHDLDQSLVILNKKDSTIKRGTIVEKLHSIRQWYNLFSKEIVKTNIPNINSLELDSRTIEVINFLTLCNGIVDTYKGIDIISKMLLPAYRTCIGAYCFNQTRKANYKHDSFFQILKYDDLKYFKHIRSIYGQHPSNLNYMINGEKVRGFSSWTFDNTRKIFNHDSDLYVNIYYDINKKPWGYKFHIYYDEIIGFVNSINKRTIDILKQLKDEIKRLVNSQKGEIENWDVMCTEERIKVLKALIEQRFFSIEEEVHIYLLEVQKLEEMLKFTSIEGYEIETLEYKNLISESLEEIKVNVENCTISELKITNKFEDDMLETIGNNWYREKFCMYLLGAHKYIDVYDTVIKLASEKLNLHVPNNHYYILFLLYKSGKVCCE